MWAFGRYDLRLSESEFWSLTPREYACLSDRAQVAIEWDDVRHALAPFIIASAHAGKKSKFKLDDFVVSSMLKNSEAAKPKKDSTSMLDKASAIFMSLGGKKG